MMRPVLALACFLVTYCSSVGQDLEVFSDHDVFFSKEVGTYVDVQMRLATSVTEPLEVVTVVELNDSIVDFRKTALLLDQVQDGSDRIHTERFALGPGSYNVAVEIKPITGEMVSVDQTVVVPRVPDSLFFSDILLAGSVSAAPEGQDSRNGYDIVPYTSTYYPPGVNSLSFYAEVYQAEKVLGSSEPYLITYSIEEFENGDVYGAFKRHKRMQASPLAAIIAEFDIKDLPSGNYRLRVEALNKDGGQLGESVQFFQRNNPDMDPALVERTNVSNIPLDTIREFLQSMRPIASDLELKMIADLYPTEDVERMQSIFAGFWMSRNPDDPWGTWAQYNAEVVRVNKNYGTRNRKGYETDRGIVHLKYGAPNTIADRANDMNAYPYQIWHYYRAGAYTNKRFIFYLPDLVTNDYVLIHSEVPGEISDPRWNQVIHSRNNSRNDVDGRDPSSTSGSNAREWFDNPR